MARRRKVKPKTNLSLAEVERALTFRQPGLSFEETDEAIVGQGEYMVHDGAHADGPLARFDLLLVFPKTYPELEPLVIERGGAIERIADRHMYANGACCTCVWEEWRALNEDTSVKAFCDGPLHNFFLGQVYFDAHEEWPFGDRAHGSDGMVEAAEALLGRDLDQAAALRFLQVVSAPATKGHWPCPCGSRKKLRDCCAEDVAALRLAADPIQAASLLKRLRHQAKSEREADIPVRKRSAAGG